MSIALKILIHRPDAQSLPGLKTDCPFWPYIVHYIEELTARLGSGKLGSDGRIILNGFLENLTQRLMAAAKNVCVAESSVVAKVQSSKSISLDSFYSILRNDEGYLADVLTAYPELDRLLMVITDNFISAAAEFCHRFFSDRAELESTFSIEKGILLAHCAVSEGETHKGGRTVVIVSFVNGQQVVYKPRDISLERSVSELLTVLSSTAGPPFDNWVVPSYLPKGNYGWVQFTGHEPVNSEADIVIFYKRMGFLLGFCTSLTASDITSDNVIAHGSSPVPIDLETIFYSVLTQRTIPREVRWNSSLTSILPNWTWKGTDGIGVDLSAIGGLTEQYVSLNLYQHISGEESDTFDMGGVKIMPNKNVLYFDGFPVKPWVYESSLQDGFKCYFEALKENQESVIHAIESFRGMDSRYVPRATATYHYAIQCSLHPTLMTSTQERLLFLEKILSSDTPPATGFIESELAACMDCDIPYALIEAGALSFVEPYYGGDGYLDEESFQDGLSHSLEYIRTLTPQRLKFEEGLICNTLVAMRSMYEHDSKLTEHRFKANDPLDGIEKFDFEYVRGSLEKALKINSIFISEKIEKELESNGLWLGFHASSGGYMEYSELGDDFYYGLSGILYGCAVASRYSVVPPALVISLKNFCYKRVIERFENPGSQLGGFHFGLASTIVPLYLSLRFTSDDRCQVLLDSFKCCLAVALEDDLWQKYFLGCDLLMGTAGCLAVITKMYELTADESLALLANKVYEKSCRNWVDDKGSLVLSFDRSITVRDDGLLTGLSHGVIGCAYSVFYYNRVIAKSNEAEALSIALLSWELTEFDGVINNWRDYRSRSSAEQGEFSWSHGLPGAFLIINYFADGGVGLAQDFLTQHPPEKYFSFDELLKRKRPVNDSLCHGAYSVLNVAKQLAPRAVDDQRLFFWANLLNFCEQDTRNLRVRTADALGLWVGKVGAVLGGIGLINESYMFPFLPHQMDDI